MVRLMKENKPHTIPNKKKTETGKDNKKGGGKQ